ncbi:hypothetical protein [Paenibacillus beijingensis]|uniref:Uncharacterized protein n=1 Tax=Paenibacillus beijingensis TaxID=1126833 RepID=A0A0D5NMH5_9BACL|nr:hypothetical protein [Paenibacillus beijingensis]AJY76481.1 hypothetical protein VN24_20290 [Paenibacillus beijingensis]
MSVQHNGTKDRRRTANEPHAPSLFFAGKVREASAYGTTIGTLDDSPVNRAGKRTNEKTARTQCPRRRALAAYVVWTAAAALPLARRERRDGSVSVIRMKR